MGLFYFLPPPHVGGVREEVSGIEVKGVGEEGDPPTSSSSGPTPFAQPMQSCFRRPWLIYFFVAFERTL